MIVGIVAADAQLLKHQAISIHNTDAIFVDPEQFMEQLVLIWINLESKAHFLQLMLKKYNFIFIMIYHNFCMRVYYFLLFHYKMNSENE